VEWRPIEQEVLAELVRSGQPQRYEKEHLRKDAGRTPVELLTHLVKDERGEPEYFFAFMTDITERKRAEEALRESEVRYRSLFEDSPVAMWEDDCSAVKAHLEELVAAGVNDVIAHVLSNPQEYARCISLTRTIDANNAAVRLFEAEDRAELLARNSDLYRRESDRGMYHFWAAMLAGECSATFEEANLSLRGREIHVLETCTVVPGHEATFDRVYVADVDITERVHAEADLREANNRLALAQRAAKAGVWGWDIPSGKLTWSPEFLELFGLPADTEASFDIWRTTLHPDDVEAAEQPLTDAIERHVALESEYRIVRPDGEQRWIAAPGDTFYDESGAPLRMTGICLDITERKQIEEALRQGEARYRALAETSPDIIFVIDREDRILYVNSKAAASVGRSPEELVGALRADLFGGETAARMESSLQLVFETGEPLEVDSQLEYPTGERWVSTSLVPIKDAEGRVEAVFGTSRDITERKRAADELSRYRLLAAEAHDIMLFVRAADGAIVEANAAAEAAYGYSREELLQLRIGDLQPARKGPTINRQVRAAGAEGILFETEHRRRDGTAFPVEVSSRGTTLIDGQAVFLSAIRDISGRKRSDQLLLQGALQLRLTLKAAVAALGSTTEMRDPYTAGHQRRVAELAAAIAAELDWDEGRIETLHTAALLHDLGKIVVPAEILSKPGRLSEIEMQIIRQHPAASAEIVADIDFEGDIAEMVLQHHERLDGSGYPRGLTGEDILPEARVLAVADVVEAMISHRPYRPSRSIEEALAEIEGGAGVLYDPDVCAACVRLIREQGVALS
jgi:PAS domain S-box-containing protein/putative nucleotidyltransferase with HDIG domain